MKTQEQKTVTLREGDAGIIFRPDGIDVYHWKTPQRVKSTSPMFHVLLVRMLFSDMPGARELRKKIDRLVHDELAKRAGLKKPARKGPVGDRVGD